MTPSFSNKKTFLCVACCFALFHFVFFFPKHYWNFQVSQFLFHLHKQAPDQKQHLRVFLIRQAGKLTSSAAFQVANSMQIRQKLSDLPQTEEYSMHCQPSCFVFFFFFLVYFNKSELNPMIKSSETGAHHQI